MALDDLFAGFKMLNEGMNQYAIGEGIRDAQAKVADLRTQQMSEMERRQQLSNISQDLTMRLGQVQAPVSQVQSVAGAIAPPAITNAEGMYAQAVAKQSPELMDMAKKMQEFETAPKLAVPKQQQEADLAKQREENVSKEGIASRNNATQLAIAKLMNETKLNVAELKTKAGKPLATKEVDTLQGFDQSTIQGKNILQTFEGDPKIVGFGEAYNPMRRFDPKKAEFDAEVGRWFDQYRKQVTGAQASEKELVMLKKNVPTINDTPAAFRQKLNNVLQIGEAVKNRYLQNLSKAGRDVSQFAGSSSVPDHSAAVKWAKENPTDPRAAAILRAQGQ